MNSNIFSEKYVKEKLNRLEQINSQKRMKVQQATLSKQPQMSRSDYEKYKKILFEQNKKQTQVTTEEKTNDTIPTKDITNTKKQDVKQINQQQNSEVIKMNKSLERNRSPKAKAGEIIFKAKRNFSKSQKSLNQSEILIKSPMNQQASPKRDHILITNSNNQNQKLKQSKSLMKLSNTQKPNEMSESQLTQEIPNSSRTQHVLQNMKSILSIASPNAYFSNMTSTMEDPNLLEQTQQLKYRQQQMQYSQLQQQQQYTPQPVSPGSHSIIPVMGYQNDNNNQVFYPTYQTQQSIEFMHTDNPQFMQQNRFMKNSQISNYQEDNSQTASNFQNYNYAQEQYQQQQQQQQYLSQEYQNNNPNFYLSPKQQTMKSEQQQHNFKKVYQPSQQNNFNSQEQQYYQATNQAYPNQQFTSPQPNNFQRSLPTEENYQTDYFVNQQAYHQNTTNKRQFSQPENINQSNVYSQQNYQDQSGHERKYSLNSYYDNHNQSNYQNQQINVYNRHNSQLDLNNRDYIEEQQYLESLSHLGIKEDLNESEVLISKLKQNQNVLKQEKEQLERELIELQNQSQNIKSTHKRHQSHQSHSYNDTSSQSIKTAYIEASFKKQIPSQQNDQNDFYEMGFERKWEILEREEEETEKSFMIISEYLNGQNEKSKRRQNSRSSNHQREERSMNKNSIHSQTNIRNKSEEEEQRPIRKNSDLTPTEKDQSLNYQRRENREEEDMEWLDGIEESFCELKCVNKNELMPYYTEIQTKKKSYLDMYAPTSNHNEGTADDDAYTRLKNQIIADSQQKMNVRGNSYKLSDASSASESQESHTQQKKELLQESAKGSRSPQFGASGKNPQQQGPFSYLNSGKESLDSLMRKELNQIKQRIGATSNAQQGLNSSNQQFENYIQKQQSIHELKRDNSQSSILLGQEDPMQKSSSCNNLIKNFYNEINEISKKNNQKFVKQDETIVQTDRTIQKSNEILDKINQKYPNTKLSLSKSETDRSPYEHQMEQRAHHGQEEELDDEGYRQQQYIMRKLNEMQSAEAYSQASSLRDKELQYSQTINSYVAQGESQFKRSQSPHQNIPVMNTASTNFIQSNDKKVLEGRQDHVSSLNRLLHKRNDQEQTRGDHINEELQMADLNNYSSFRNDLQQSEQQHQEYYEDQYFKLSNNKNSSFEKELQQIQMDRDGNNKNKAESEQIQSQPKKNLYADLMRNIQKDSGSTVNVKKDTETLLQGSNSSNSTSIFQKKLDSRMEEFYKQQNEPQKYEDKSRKMSSEGQQKSSSISAQMNKVFPNIENSDDESESSGDELEETILQKLQKLKKKRDSEKKEKSPLSQHTNITSDQKNRPLTASKRGSQDSASSNNEQLNKENTYSNTQFYKNSLMSSATSNEQQQLSGAQMKLDELFNKKIQQQYDQQSESSANKSHSTRDKISSIQQKLNNLFEKKNNMQSPQQHQPEKSIENIQSPSHHINNYTADTPKQITYQKENQIQLQEHEPRIDRQVIDDLASEVEMLMKMQNLESKYKQSDSENRQLKEEYLKHERHIYGEDGDMNLQGDEDYDSYQSESQKNFFKNKQQLPLYEIEEEHSIDNSLIDQNFQLKNQFM